MTLFLFALLIVGAALVFVYYDSHRSAAVKDLAPSVFSDTLDDAPSFTDYFA